MTLIEVLFASVIGAIIVAGVYMGMMHGLRMNYLNSQYVASMGLAKQKMEQLRSSAVDDYTLVTGGTESNIPLTHMGGYSRQMIACDRVTTVVITNTSAPGAAEYKRVTVTVKWTFMGHTASNSLIGIQYRTR